MTIKTSLQAISRDPDLILRRLRDLGRGEKLVYHQGSLASDRSLQGLEWVAVEDARDIGLLASAARELSNKGAVHLTQRKLAEGVYQYIATGV
jgi:hypothetical protein